MKFDNKLILKTPKIKVKIKDGNTISLCLIEKGFKPNYYNNNVDGHFLYLNVIHKSFTILDDKKEFNNLNQYQEVFYKDFNKILKGDYEIRR